MNKQFFAIIAPIALCVALTGCCGSKKSPKEEKKEVAAKTVSVTEENNLEQTTEIVVHLDNQETTQA